MDTATIKTNGHARELKSYADLPHEARENFAYIFDDGIEPENVEDCDETYNTRFFEYRGSWYDAHEFTHITRQSAKLRDPLAYNPFGLRVGDDSPFLKWEGVQTESYFSAVLIRFPMEWDGMTTDYDAVVVGYAHW